MFVSYIVYFTLYLMRVWCVNYHRSVGADMMNIPLLDDTRRDSHLNDNDLQASEEQRATFTQPIDVVVIDLNEAQLQSTSRVRADEPRYTNDQSIEMYPLVYDGSGRYKKHKYQHSTVLEEHENDVIEDVMLPKREQDARESIDIENQSEEQNFGGMERENGSRTLDKRCKTIIDSFSEGNFGTVVCICIPIVALILILLVSWYITNDEFAITNQIASGAFDNLQS